MGASPVQPIELSFTSKDLTDTYADDTSQYSDSTVGNRHPRGESPINLRSATTSTNATLTSSGSERGGGRSDSSQYGVGNGSKARSNGGGRTEGPDLERLLDFLDDENDNGVGSSRISYTQSRNLSKSTTIHQHDPVIPSSSTPPPLSTLNQTSPILPPQPIRYDPINNSQYFPSPSSHSSSSNGNKRNYNSKNIDRSTSRVEEVQVTRDVPESPSPLPGSMSGILRNINGVRITTSTTWKGKEKARANEDGRGIGSNNKSEVPLSAEVLDEFSSIISQGTPDRNYPSRPISRLRNIQSPDFMLQDHQAPRSPVHINNRSSSDDHAAEEIPNNNPSSGKESDEDRDDLLEELRKAKKYIAHLKSEMVEISAAVKGLRVESKSGSSLPHLPANDTARSMEDATPRDTLELAKHIISLLPPVTTTSAPVPSIHSIVLALEFTRSIDNLIYPQSYINHTSNLNDKGLGNVSQKGSDVGGGGGRRDEDIFVEGNLAGLLRRVKGWERGVRGS